MSKFFSSNLAAWLLVISCMLLGLFLRYSFVFQNLDEPKLIDSWSDGFKTYTNTIYHIEHDSTLLHFDGMNYPFGEPILQATELPGLAILLKALKPIFPNISAQVIPIIHLELMLAVFLCGLLIFQILRMWKLPVLYALLGALAITFLSPNNLRMGSHYGLAQHFVIPLIFLLLLRFSESRHWFNSLLLAGSILLSSFLHVYFFSITVLAVSAYIFFEFMRKRDLENFKSLTFHYAIMVGIPLITLVWLIMGNDPVSDRSPKPFGFFTYKTNLEGFFLNPDHPAYAWINDNLVGIRKTEMEGQVYLGVTTGLFLLILFFKWLFSLFRKPFLYFLDKTERSHRILFYTGLVLGLYSLGLPFIIPGLKPLLDYTGPLQQFRSIGRFGWVFYYSMSLIAFLGWYRWYSKQQSKGLKIGLVAIFLLLIAQDIYHFTFRRLRNLQEVNNFTYGTKFNEFPQLTSGRYQAVIPVPYFNVGSNNYISQSDGFALQKTLLIGTQCGIPTTGAMLARSSLGQSLMQHQLMLPNCTPPAAFAFYTDDRPLLLFWSKKMKEEQGAKFSHLVEMADLVLEDKNFILYELKKADFLNRLEQNHASIVTEMDSLALFQHQTLLSTDSTKNFFYKDFEDLSADKAFEGKGSFKGKLETPHLILDESISLDSSTAFLFNVWTYALDDRLTANMFWVKELDEVGNTLKEHAIHTGGNTKTIHTSGWALVEKKITFSNKTKRLQVRFGREHIKHRITYVDQLLLRPLHTDVYLKTPDRIYKNNWFYETLKD